jgi:putative CRISPR-associated protein (TIGR02619 family)
MKKVITTVGTSIFDNYLDEKKDIITHHKAIKDRSSDDWDRFKDHSEKIRESLTGWAKENEDASAEIKSLRKIKESIKEPLDVYLIASDTITSRLAAEIIKEVFNNNELNIYFDPKEDVIKNLQVKDVNRFREGLENLINRIDKIVGGYWDNVLINITGGYKVIIPYLTILGQINRCSIYYIFEETDKLIEISPTPIHINWGLFEKYSHLLKKFEEGVYDLNALKQEYSEYDDFYYEFKNLIWQENKMAELNPLGKIFWKNFKTNLLVYIPKESDYFEKLKDPDKRKIENAMRELYRRLISVIEKVGSKDEAIKKIINLGEKNDLRHADVIDTKTGVFIFKSTNEEHIRLLYSFEIDKEGEISSIRIYDFVYQKFDHEAYIKDFKNKYPSIKDKETTILPVKKEV